MKTETKKFNPYSSFWALLSKTDKYNPLYKEDIKRAWVREFSNGQTDSLSVLYYKYPFAYKAMIRTLKEESKKIADRADRQRKKLLALIFELCKHKGYTCDTKKAILIACKACGVDHLNEAPENKIIAVIKAFKAQEGRAWAASVLDTIFKAMNN